MVEQSHSGEGHGDAILVAGVYDIVVSHGAAGLCYVLHAAFVRAFYIISEWEEGI